MQVQWEQEGARLNGATPKHQLEVLYKLSPLYGYGLHQAHLVPPSPEAHMQCPTRVPGQRADMVLWGAFDFIKTSRYWFHKDLPELLQGGQETRGHMKEQMDRPDGTDP